MASAAIPCGRRSWGRVALANDAQRRDVRRIAFSTTTGIDEPAALVEGRAFSKQGEPTPEPAQTAPPQLPDLPLVRSHKTVSLNQTGAPCPPRCLASESVAEPDMLLISKVQAGYLGCALSCGLGDRWLVGFEAACGLTSPRFLRLEALNAVHRRSSLLNGRGCLRQHEINE